MLILTGHNLGERQRDLNLKVNEAAMKRVSFEEIKDRPISESSDVDKLFKIDLASRYRNIEYIIEVLKSGDSLHISRALKCTWMYDDEYSSNINVKNLHKNVIPFMSAKMKKKLLLAISTHVRNEDRAAEFYKYCIDEKLDNFALKFLYFTKDDFKLEVINDESSNYIVTSLEGENLMSFIRYSFTLAEAFIAINSVNTRYNIFRDLSYLFTVSNIKYLDLLEQSVKSNCRYNHLGLRISKVIMKKHKRRVLSHPSLYVSLLSSSVLVRYSTADDAKIYLKALMPDNVRSFWNQNYCDTYKDIINLIPKGKFEFIKELFTSSYQDEQFEMSLNFYTNQCYTLMTDEEKEEWALKQIESGEEILGKDGDYIWYQFVNFEKAFAEIKKLVRKTTDRMQRADIINILLDSAKDQRDVQKLLEYYYEKHVNEDKNIKENFLDRVIQCFDVYKFDDACWLPLDRLFSSLHVYNDKDQYSGKSEYKIIALVYSIINNKKVHEAIELHIKTSLYFYTLKLNTDKLSKGQQQMVFDYLFGVYMSEIRAYENAPYDDEVKYELRKYIHFALDLLEHYGKTKDDCPEIMKKFMKLDWSEFEFHRLFQTKEKSEPINLIKELKKDANILIKKLPIIKTNIDGDCYNLRQFQQILKVYFSNDIAKNFLGFYKGLLEDDDLYYKNANAATHGIFQLADDTFKKDFMKEYAPKESKIPHGDIDNNLLLIQKAICAHACYSRPPVALEDMLNYIKGDYVQYTLPSFHYFLANLPLPQCIEFVQALLDKPVSVQKHGIRLAFKCFSAENLNKIVLDVCGKTKNVSLRNVIYKALYSKVRNDENSQNILFDTLKTITLTINQDDDDDLFSLLAIPYDNAMPNHLISEYMKVVWQVVSQLPKKQSNLIRINSVLNSINENFNLVNHETIKTIVDEFVASIINEESSDKANNADASKNVNEAKWNLTAKYILHAENQADLDTKLELTHNLMEKWLLEPKNTLRETCFSFISNLETSSYSTDIKYFKNINVVMASIKKQVEEMLPLEVNYDTVWDLELGLVTRKVLTETHCEISGADRTKLIKPVALNYAEVLGELITHYIDTGNYFASLYKEISNMIRNKINILGNKLKMNSDELVVFMSVKLIELDKTEIYFLVLDLLPSYYRPEYNGDFGIVLNKLKQLDSKEIRCHLYRKFNKGLG